MSVSPLGELRTRVRAVISLLLAAVAAVAMSATGVVLATSSAGAAGSAPTITNSIAAFTVGENEPTPNTFDLDTLVQGGVANIDTSSLTIVTPAPAGDATSTLTQRRPTASSPPPSPSTAAATPWPPAPSA